MQDFNNGNWSALKTQDTAWSLYNGIRAANEFIASIADVDFSRFEYGPSYPNWERQLRYFPYEARMLRAFYFFELARRYGDIAMPTRMLTIEEANTIGKTSFDEVIGFIVAECDACAADGNLPNTYVGERTRTQIQGTALCGERAAQSFDGCRALETFGEGSAGSDRDGSLFTRSGG